MPNLVIGGFGLGGGSTPIYGWGIGAPSTPFISPGRGLIAGGDPFALVGLSVSNLTYGDTFTAGSLDLAKWTDLSSGGGSVATGVGGLKLNLTTAGGTASIRSVQLYKNFDVAVTYSYNNAIEQLAPALGITYISLTARISAGNTFSVAHTWNPTMGPTITGTVFTSAVGTNLFTIPLKGAAGTLGLVRYGGHMQVYVGSEKVYDFGGWRNTDCGIEVTSTSPAQPLALRTTVTDYTPSILVTFGNDICPFAAESEDRILGITPTVSLPGLVEVQAHSVVATTTLGVGSFEYFTPLQLTISRNNNTVEVNNDNTLRDTSTTEKGFRI